MRSPAGAPRARILCVPAPDETRAVNDARDGGARARRRTLMEVTSGVPVSGDVERAAARSRRRGVGERGLAVLERAGVPRVTWAALAVLMALTFALLLH